MLSRARMLCAPRCRQLLTARRHPKRHDGEGEGWQTRSDTPAVGVHFRERGPGDSFSLPYFTVGDIAAALEKVAALGGTVVHPGEQWAICKDSEGSRSAWLESLSGGKAGPLLRSRPL